MRKMVPLQERRDPNADVSPAPYDAWVFAKARAGHPINGEARRVSGTHRELARRLAEADVEDRDRAWDAHLSTLSEAEAGAWIEAVAAVNPDGPAPEDDGWGQPLAFKLPPVEPFPLDVYPAAAVRLIRQGATSIGCPADFLALPVLAVAGAALGRSASLRLKSGYFASASIYAVCVGLPGDGKSPAVSAIASPMRSLDEAHFAAWKEEKAAFEIQHAQYESASKAAGRGRPKRGKEDEPVELDPVKPVPPVPRRAVVGDSTIESLNATMGQNPRGLLQVLDEVSSLVTSMNQYRGGKGSDRQWYLSTWSGQPTPLKVVQQSRNVL